MQQMNVYVSAALPAEQQMNVYVSTTLPAEQQMNVHLSTTLPAEEERADKEAEEDRAPSRLSAISSNLSARALAFVKCIFPYRQNLFLLYVWGNECVSLW